MAEAANSKFSFKAVEKALDRRVFAPGEVIIIEGEDATGAYILLKGDVTIATGLGTDHMRELTTIKPGQFFGELALMADMRRTASALTINGCELLVVSQDKLKAKLADADPFLRYWIEYLSKRVIDLTAR